MAVVEGFTHPAKFKLDDGIHHGIKESVYFGLDRLNASTLQRIETSPASFKFGWGIKEAETPAMRFGRAVHSMVLEGEKAFEERFAVFRGKGDRRSKAFRTWQKDEKGNVRKELRDKTILKGNEYKTVLNIKNALRKRMNWKPLLDALEPEVVVCATMRGRKVKARIDGLVRSGEDSLLFELKTTRMGLTPGGFARTAANMGYFWKAAFYLDMYNAVADEKIDKFVFGIVDPDVIPFESAMYVPSANAMEQGRQQYNLMLDMLDACEGHAYWPDRSDRIVAIEPSIYHDPVGQLEDWMDAINKQLEKEGRRLQ